MKSPHKYRWESRIEDCRAKLESHYEFADHYIDQDGLFEYGRIYKGNMLFLIYDPEEIKGHERWYAYDLSKNRPDGPCIGRYATADEARRAVETAIGAF